MAEAMISTIYRESLQSLDGMAIDQSINGEENGEQEPQKDSSKRVKHGPTTIIQIDDEKRRKVSTSVTANHVVEGKLKGNSIAGPKDILRRDCVSATLY